MQGQGVQVGQIAEVAALLVMIDAAYILGAAYSPGLKGNPKVANPGEQAELLKKFMQLPVTLQRGCLKYADELRHSYQRERLKLRA